jgi:hypothetical protein
VRGGELSRPPSAFIGARHVENRQEATVGSYCKKFRANGYLRGQPPLGPVDPTFAQNCLLFGREVVMAISKLDPWWFHPDAKLSSQK